MHANLVTLQPCRLLTALRQPLSPGSSKKETSQSVKLAALTPAQPIVWSAVSPQHMFNRAKLWDR